MDIIIVLLILIGCIGAHTLYLWISVNIEILKENEDAEPLSLSEFLSTIQYALICSSKLE